MRIVRIFVYSLLTIFSLVLIWSFVVVPILFCWGLGDSKAYEGKIAKNPKKVGITQAEKLMPLSAVDIEYKSFSSFRGTSVSYKCTVSEEDFLAFATQKGLVLSDKQPDNSGVSFEFYKENEMPEDYYYGSENHPNPIRGLRIMYDKKTHIMYGRKYK